MKVNPFRRMIEARKVESVVDEMVKEKMDDIFKDACKQMLPQYMAICLLELKTEFGFGKERLNKFKRGVDEYMEISRNDGFCGKEFDGLKVMEMLKNDYGIDLSNVDITIKTQDEGGNDVQSK